MEVVELKLVTKRESPPATPVLQKNRQNILKWNQCKLGRPGEGLEVIREYGWAYLQLSFFLRLNTPRVH